MIYSEYISIITILPVLLLLIGIYVLVKGTFSAQHKVFKPAFLLFFLNALVSIFMYFLLDNSGNLPQIDAFTVYMFTSIVLGIFSFVGVLYTSFQSFLPPIFIRISFLFSMVAMGLGIYVAYHCNTTSETMKVNQMDLKDRG